MVRIVNRDADGDPNRQHTRHLARPAPLLAYNAPAGESQTALKHVTPTARLSLSRQRRGFDGIATCDYSLYHVTMLVYYDGYRVFVGLVCTVFSPAFSIVTHFVQLFPGTSRCVMESCMILFRKQTTLLDLFKLTICIASYSQLK